MKGILLILVVYLFRQAGTAPNLPTSVILLIVLFIPLDGEIPILCSFFRILEYFGTDSQFSLKALQEYSSNITKQFKLFYFLFEIICCDESSFKVIIVSFA